MAEVESPSLDSHQTLGEVIHAEIDTSDVLESAELSNPLASIDHITGRIDELLVERRLQREKMLIFVQSLTTKSFYLLTGVVSFQGFVRLFSLEYEVINDTVFNILAVSVFGQVISVIVVIVKSLWDDSEYLKKI